MFKSRINTWGLEKKLKACDVVQLLRLKHERETLGKPSSVFTVRGRTVDWDRVNTYIKRKGLEVSAILTVVGSDGVLSNPSADIICRTPSPDLPDSHQPKHPGSSVAESPGSLCLPPSIILRMRQVITCGTEEKHDQETVIEDERSREWTTMIRYKLAMYRSFLESQERTQAVSQFRKFNRSFALLEPVSGNHIGIRLFYLLNFVICFRGDGFLPNNPLSSTASRLEEELRSFYNSSRRTSTVLCGESSMRDSDILRSRMDSHKPVCSSSLVGVLRNLVKFLGLTFPAESVLLLEESDRERPLAEVQQLAGDCSIGRAQRGENERKSRLRNPGAELESAIWLLSRGMHKKAKDILIRLADIPTSSRKSKTLSRIASHHLSRMYKRQGDTASAEHYSLQSVRDSLFLDSWLTWDEASFLFA